MYFQFLSDKVFLFLLPTSSCILVHSFILYCFSPLIFLSLFYCFVLFFFDILDYSQKKNKDIKGKKLKWEITHDSHAKYVFETL